MDKIYRVFISSTYNDLIEERKEISQALLEMDCFPTGMELFQASDKTQWELIKKVIDSCDYYIVIIAGRYGSIHEKTNKSYTQMEYEYAIESKIPTLGFIYKDIDALPLKKIDNLARVKEFINLVQRKEVRFWSTPHELAGMVSRAMHRIMIDQPREGWTRSVKSTISNEQIETMQETLSKLVLNPSLFTDQLNNPLKNSENTQKAKDKTELKESQSLFKNDCKSLRMNKTEFAAMEEITNIIISSGLTAFCSLLEWRICAGFPSFNFYDDGMFLCNIERSNITYISYEFRGESITGVIVMAIDSTFLSYFYDNHIKNYTLTPDDFLKFNSKEYKDSVRNELGSIFCGSCATTISDILKSERIEIRPINTDYLMDFIKNTIPIFSGILPFLNNAFPASYILLDVEAVKTFLSSKNIFLTD